MGRTAAQPRVLQEEKLRAGAGGGGGAAAYDQGVGAEGRGKSMQRPSSLAFCLASGIITFLTYW